MPDKLALTKLPAEAIRFFRHPLALLVAPFQMRRLTPLNVPF